MTDQKVQKSSSINLENKINMLKINDDNVIHSFQPFNEKLEFKLSEDNKEIELTFKISLTNSLDKNSNLEFEYKMKKDLNYFLSLHDSYVLFKRDINFVHSKIKEKLDKNNFAITLNFSRSITNHLQKLFKSYKNQENTQDENNFALQELNEFIVLELLFRLDEENIYLNIQFDNLVRIGNKILKENTTKTILLEKENTKENSDIFFLTLSESKIVRKANAKDVSLILSFIKELAEFELLLHEVTATEEILAKNLFGPKAYSEVLICEINSAPVAIALFFHNFSTFKGKPGLYLEDIYVKPEFRKQRIGSDFFNILAKIAKERDCGRFEWSVLNWNQKAIKFYKKMGAYPMSEWTVYRIDKENIDKLADV